MKIIIIAENIKGNNGWGRYSLDLAYGLSKRGHDILFIVQELTPESNFVQRECLQDPLKYISNPWLSLKDSFKLNKIIREFKPDIVQFTVEPYGTMIPFINKNGCKVVLNAHSTFAYLPILVKGLKRKFLQVYSYLIYFRVDSVFVLSRYTKTHLERYIHIPENKIDMIGGALNIDAFPSHSAKKDNSPKIIMMAGAIKPRKGILESINALAFVKTDFVYNVVGAYTEGDGYVKILRDRIKELRFENKVKLLGKISHTELQELYKKADLYLMLSTNNGADFEGYGLVYLEANNYGIPCIGPNDSGVSDAIVDGKTGYIVDQFKPEEVAKKIDEVLTQDKINQKDCIEWAQKNSVTEQAKKVEEVYNRLIK